MLLCLAKRNLVQQTFLPKMCTQWSVGMTDEFRSKAYKLQKLT